MGEEESSSWSLPLSAQGRRGEEERRAETPRERTDYHHLSHCAPYRAGGLLNEHTHTPPSLLMLS
jgi:hypothetical protein